LKKIEGSVMASGKKKSQPAGQRPARQPSGLPARGLFWPEDFPFRQLPAELIPFWLCQEQIPAGKKSLLSRILKSFIN